VLSRTVSLGINYSMHDIISKLLCETSEAAIWMK